MKTEHLEFQRKIINWFSGLTLIDAQKSKKALHVFLLEVDGIKSRSKNTCLLSPCHRHIYSRGLCARHYAMVNKIRKLVYVDWVSMKELGLCRYSMKEDEIGKKGVRITRPNDPLNILIKK
jgi:hypothetical protein